MEGASEKIQRDAGTVEGDGEAETSTDSRSLEEKLEGVRYCFRDKQGKMYLLRCPICELENHALSVASGECAWCGWKEKK